MDGFLHCIASYRTAVHGFAWHRIASHRIACVVGDGNGVSVGTWRSGFRTRHRHHIVYLNATIASRNISTLCPLTSIAQHCTGNAAAEQLYGWSAEEAVGRDISNVTVPEVSQEAAAEIMAALREGRPWSGGFPVRRRGGEVLHALVTDSGVTAIANTRPLGIPLLVWIFAAVALVGWVVLNRTTYGRRTYAVGGNSEAARLAGINVGAPAHIVPSADFGLIGLAVMGQNLILNVADHGFTVCAYNRTTAKVDRFLENEAKGKLIHGSENLKTKWLTFFN